MPIYQAVVLAIVQGLTEFLPISSTAHLWLIPWIMKWKDPGLTFDIALHAGTLVAVLGYFWRYWLEMVRMVLGLNPGYAPAAAAASSRTGAAATTRTQAAVERSISSAGASTATAVQQTNAESALENPKSAGPLAMFGENRQLFWSLVLATIPAAIAGWRFEHAADERLRSPVIIGTALVVVGLLMWAGERLGRHEHDLGQVSWLDSLIVGVAQAFAVIPGVSRSGSTMTAGLLRGMKRETAARFSFLLSTPIIGGACLKKAMEIHHQGVPAGMLQPFAFGIIVSAIVGYAVITVLIRYLERRTFTVFVVYRVILGVILLAVGWGLRH